MFSSKLILPVSVRLVFFCKSETGGISAVVALKKSDRRAIKSLSAVLHLHTNDDDDEDDDEGEGQGEDMFEKYALDFRDLL
jgi:hypothetical protein